MPSKEYTLAERCRGFAKRVSSADMLNYLEHSAATLSHLTALTAELAERLEQLERNCEVTRERLRKYESEVDGA